MIKAIKHVSIPVEDQSRAVRFYTEKLGFTLKKDIDFGESQRWIELGIPGEDTIVVLFTLEGQEDRIGSFSNIMFSTDDVQKSHDELVAKGVEIVVPPTQEPWGTYCNFKDSEGNTFCLSTEHS